jgi:hypothetical protein
VEELGRLGRALREAHEEYEDASAECIRLAASADSTKDQIAAADARRRAIYEKYVTLLSDHTNSLVIWEVRNHGTV